MAGRFAAIPRLSFLPRPVLLCLPAFVRGRCAARNSAEISPFEQSPCPPDPSRTWRHGVVQESAMSDLKPNRILEIIRRLPSLADMFFRSRLARWVRRMAEWRRKRIAEKRLMQVAAAPRRRTLLET